MNLTFRAATDRERAHRDVGPARFHSRLGVGVVGALALLAFAPAASAQIERCKFDGVRVVVADGGESSVVELSVRVKGDAPDSACSVDFSQVTLSAPEGAAPTIAVSQTFVDHRLTGVDLADGVNAVQPRLWRGSSGVVAMRWLVEGTAGGLRVEVPRTTFPKAYDAGARVERRVKSARGGTAKFGPLGDLQILASTPGAAGGAGPTGPALDERVIAEFVPGSAPVTEGVPAPLVTLESFRSTLPLRVLDLSAANEDGWTEVAKRAYAAALHGDPVVASLGVHTLAWLGSGLSLQAVKIGPTASADTAPVPASVLTAVGDVEARLTKRHGGQGRLLPLGRPGIFRKALTSKPWDDTARANAAKAAVARLATVQPQDLAPFLVPSIIDGAAAPIDPPQSVHVEPQPIIPNVPSAIPATPYGEPAAIAPRGRRRSPRKRYVGVFVGLVAAAAAIGWTLRSQRA